VPITKEQIIAVIQSAARELGRTPTCVELEKLSGLKDKTIRRHFHTYMGAVKAAGLEPHKQGQRLSSAALLEDWGQVVRKLGCIPTRKEYLREGNHGIISFWNRFHGWAKVPIEFCEFARSGKLAGEWADVLDNIRHGPMLTRGGSRWQRRWREQLQAAHKSGQARFEQSPAGSSIQVNPAGPANPSTLVNPAIQANASIQASAAIQANATSSANPENPSSSAIPASWAISESWGSELPGPPGKTPMLPAPLLNKPCVTMTMLTVFVAELAPGALQWISGGGLQRRVKTDRPLLGAPTRIPGMAYAPVNEMGVVLLFGMLAQRLGFIIEAVQSGFPDCEAIWEVEPGRWQRIRIEFEYESRNFKDHGHDPRGCDLLVCWRHNWKNAPPDLEILELSSLLHFA
jgi:hypothetical protein